MWVVSIDVGIKNLACCLLEVHKTDVTIHKWNVLNLCTEPVCSNCPRTAIYSDAAKNRYCDQCARDKLPGFLLCTPSVQSAISKPWDKEDLSKLCRRMNRPEPDLSTGAKCDALVRKIKGSWLLTRMPKPKASDMSMSTTCERLHKQLKNFASAHYDLDIVIIENQLGPQAVKMKTIQAMCCQWFISARGLCGSQILSVPASKKLANFINKEDKTTYSERKKLSVELCLAILNLQKMLDSAKLLRKSSKADDLADSLLQALAYLQEGGILDLDVWKLGRGLLKIKCS